MNVCFQLSISPPYDFLLGCTKARFVAVAAQVPMPALVFIRIPHWKFCSLDPRCSPSPELFMRPNSFYGLRSAFASGYVA